MIKTILSTQQVAALLNVTETTVKRWADEGEIVCSKTLGGHRKFLMNDVIRFAEENGIVMSGTMKPPMNARQIEQLEFAVYMKHYNKISEIFLEEALQADREGLEQLVLYLLQNHISFPTIADEVIRPALVSIGVQWAKGKLAIDQEHSASQAVTEAMIRVSSAIHRKPKNGLHAVCACPFGEYHEIGLRGLAYSLEGEGWNVNYTGANTPLDSLLTLISRTKPELLALSFTTMDDEVSIKKNLRTIGDTVHANRGIFITGGFTSGRFKEEELGCDHIALSTTEAIAYVRDAFQLKPGPKRKIGPKKSAQEN